jgi:hypothetical protein
MTKKPTRIYWPALQRAADLIRKVGWCQNQPEDADGKVCASRAIRRVTRTRDARVENEWHAEDVITRGCWLAMWNDRKGRTKRQVIDALERAARTP